MIAANKDNQQEILAFIPAIKANLAEWQIVTIRLANIHMSQPEEIQRKFLKVYSGKEGLSFITKDNRVIFIIRLGKLDNYTRLKNDIEKQMEGHRCRVIAKRVNKQNLNQVSIDLSDNEGSQERTLYTAREERKENVILVAEDDAFIRKTLQKLLGKTAVIHEVDDGSNVLEAYEKYNPDITILDIHMPNQNGLELMQGVFDLDYDAFIIVTSADSVRSNVLDAIAKGAAGFLAKPIQKERLSDFLSQSITYKAPDLANRSLEIA